MISLVEIEKFAALARLELDETEKKKIRTDVEAILEYVKQVQDISVGNGAPEKTGLVNMTREDEKPHKSGIFTETLLSAAPEREGDYVKVKKIL